MFSNALDEIYKFKTSGMTIPQILDEIYIREHEAIEKSSGHISPVDVEALLCLRDLKEWLFKLESRHVNTYVFRKQIDNIKTSREFYDIDRSCKPISRADIEMIRNYIEAGKEYKDDEIKEVFRAMYNTLFND